MVKQTLAKKMAKPVIVTTTVQANAKAIKASVIQKTTNSISKRALSGAATNKVITAKAKPVSAAKLPNKILITQPKPESHKSPYFELERKYAVQIVFQPFIQLEPIIAREFRKQRIDVASHTSVIFTSKNAIDHFFRLTKEMKSSISGDTKYFCSSEAVALYLQKFILYRKRKVFYGAHGTTKCLCDVINRHRENELFLYPCSENQQDGEIVSWLKSHKCEFCTAFMYRTVSVDVSSFLLQHHFDVMCFFTPSGVRSFLQNSPKFKQNGLLIGAFGNNTVKAINDAGLTACINAPLPSAPSMIAALDNYLSVCNKS